MKNERRSKGKIVAVSSNSRIKEARFTIRIQRHLLAWVRAEAKSRGHDVKPAAVIRELITNAYRGAMKSAARAGKQEVGT